MSRNASLAPRPSGSVDQESLPHAISRAGSKITFSAPGYFPSCRQWYRVDETMLSVDLRNAVLRRVDCTEPVHHYAK